MRVGDLGLGAGLVPLALAVLWYSRGFPRIEGQFYGPGFFPGIVAAALAVCGLLLAARGLRERARGAAPGAPDGDEPDGDETAPVAPATRRGLVSVALAFAATLAFLFAGGTLGFHLLTFATLLVFYLWLRQGPLWSLGLAAGLTLAFDLLFRMMLKVPLPLGPLAGVI